MKRVGLVVAAAAITLFTGAGTAAADPVVPPAGLGFTDGAPFLTYPNDVIDSELDAGKQFGMTRVRIVVDWRAVETAPGVFDWSNVDRGVDLARARGYSVLAVLAGTPLWAQGAAVNPLVPGVPPAGSATFGAFAGAAAAHLGNRVDDYEVWNEPNIPAFFTPVSADRYVSLLRAAYTAIHAADSSATVVSGGLAPTVDDGGSTVAPVTFLTQLYAAGAGPFLDAVALHPYTFPFTAENDPNGRWEQVERAHEVMDAAGDGDKKIWITEIGAPTSGVNSVPVDVQRAIIESNTARAASLPYVGPVFVRSLRDSGTDLGDAEQNFGLLRSDFSRK